MHLGFGLGFSFTEVINKSSSVELPPPPDPEALGTMDFSKEQNSGLLILLDDI
jgi:hypothetical protein